VLINKKLQVCVFHETEPSPLPGYISMMYHRVMPKDRIPTQTPGYAVRTFDAAEQTLVYDDPTLGQVIATNITAELDGSRYVSNIWGLFVPSVPAVRAVAVSFIGKPYGAEWDKAVPLEDGTIIIPRNPNILPSSVSQALWQEMGLFIKEAQLKTRR
jgi:hypothetical protein